MNQWMRHVVRVAVVGAVVLASVVVAANVIVVARTNDAVTSDPDDLGPAQVVIVPGSHVRDDGSLGPVVAERVEAAVALYLAGVVEKVLVSGDNGTASYNETDAMRDAVLAAGVPAADVFTDYAGFSTWHTMSRARDVFGVETAVAVTQGAYVARAVDLGNAAGIDTQGYVTREGGRRGRELLARVRGLAEATWRPSVAGGPAIPITGDGRDSWADQAGRPGRANSVAPGGQSPVRSSWSPAGRCRARPLSDVGGPAVLNRPRLRARAGAHDKRWGDRQALNNVPDLRDCGARSAERPRTPVWGTRTPDTPTAHQQEQPSCLVPRSTSPFPTSPASGPS